MSAGTYKHGRGQVNLGGLLMERVEKLAMELGDIPKADVVRYGVAVLEAVVKAERRGARVICQEWKDDIGGWGPAIEWKALV